MNESALGGTLSFNTPATTSSTVGNYTITPLGLTSSNYTLTYNNGQLSITSTSGASSGGSSASGGSSSGGAGGSSGTTLTNNALLESENQTLFLLNPVQSPYITNLSASPLMGGAPLQPTAIINGKPFSLF